MGKICLNGNEVSVENGSTVLDIILSRSIEPTQVVVELNGKILERSQFAHTSPDEGDVLEILRFVGGG
ncbi:thiamine biosynthesis protein ThiS [Chitinispirillum alkaliphilum]|nr:thiamine biosynthesis protein ThiS [Chitinispirillum alkaliphilum]